MEIEWKELKVYNKNITKLYDFSDIYKVSNDGHIMNIKRKSILKSFKHQSGYHTSVLSKNGFTKAFLLHRIVATSFHINPDKKCFVNHKNRNPGDNNASNLEWVTAHENNQHAHKTGIKSYTRSVKRINENGGEKFYDSIKNASNLNNTSTPVIIRACQNNTQLVGYYWSYINNYTDCTKDTVEYYNMSDTVLAYDMKDNPNYEVYSDGRIFSKAYCRFLSPSIQNGYLALNIHPGPKRMFIHQLVAQTFIDNPENKKYVNHMDRNKQNNHEFNLEWCTHQENMDHAHNKKVYQYNKKGNLVQEYNSVTEASQQSNVSECLISSIVHKNRLTGGGYIWRNKPTTFTEEELDKIYNPPNSRALEIIQMTKEGVEINRYPTIIKAAQSIKIDPSSVAKACKGVTKICGGYKWKYAGDNCSKRLTKQEQLEIVQKHKDGILVNELAKVYKKSVDSIRRVIKKNI